MNYLDFQVKKNPRKPFILHDGNTYSYLDVFEMVQVYSRSFLRLGIKCHDRVLISLPSGLEMAETILSCFEIGAIAAPISINLTNEERLSILKKINPSIIITNWEGQESFSSESCLVACIEELPSSSSACSVLKNEFEWPLESVNFKIEYFKTISGCQSFQTIFQKF